MSDPRSNIVREWGELLDPDGLCIGRIVRCSPRDPHDGDHVDLDVVAAKGTEAYARLTKSWVTPSGRMRSAFSFYLPDQGLGLRMFGKGDKVIRAFRTLCEEPPDFMLFADSVWPERERSGDLCLWMVGYIERVRE